MKTLFRMRANGHSRKVLLNIGEFGFKAPEWENSLVTWTYGIATKETAQKADSVEGARATEEEEIDGQSE